MKYFLLTLLLTYSFVLCAQSIIINPSPASGSGLPTDLFIKIESMVTNNTNAMMDVRWERYNVQLPTAWDNAVCDKNGCYAPSVDTETFSINPGEMSILSIWFVPSSTAGTGTVDLRVYNVADSASTVITTSFTATAQLTDSEDLTIEDYSVFPNPASDFIQLPDYAQIAAVRLYDVIGREMMFQAVTEQKNQLDVSSLNNGAYLIQFLDKDQRILNTSRIIKD